MKLMKASTLVKETVFNVISDFKTMNFLHELSDPYLDMEFCDKGIEPTINLFCHASDIDITFRTNGVINVEITKTITDFCYRRDFSAQDYYLVSSFIEDMVGINEWETAV